MVDTTQKVKIVSLVGKRYPLESTAAGQVLLAFNHAREEQPTDNTSLDSKQCAAICSQGYNVDVDALGEGITSVAAPLFGSGGKLLGTVVVVGPEFRLASETIQEHILNPLLDACGIISSKLGWHSPYIPRNLT
jgi:DNA-binding IclR family transcriptional regulator